MKPYKVYVAKGNQLEVIKIRAESREDCIDQLENMGIKESNIDSIEGII